ncbi:MAG: Y-family DNA polymerase [Alphaproteobacteria bacterium]
MRRYLALWFPYLPTERLRRMPDCAAPADAPLVLTEKQRGALRLSAVDARAAALGLAPGLTLADARARIPDLAAVPADRGADATLLRHLADACDRYTPLVACDPPDGLVLDVTGCAHLFGGEAALRDAARTEMRHCGLTVRAALAGTPHTARAVARFGRPAVVPPGREEAAARPLPVAALEADTDTLRAVARAGLATLGDLADRPSAALSARFGAAAVRRLGRILGHEDARIVSLRPPPEYRAEGRFAEPMTHLEGIEAALAQLIDAVCRQLEAGAAGGRLFEASFFRSDGAVARIRLETGRPVRDGGVLRRLFHERSAALADPVDPGYGFDLFRLAVLAAESMHAPQLRLDGGADRDADLAALLDRLAARFGRERVLRFAPRDAHRPEGEAVLIPASGPAPASPCPWPLSEPGEPPRRPIRMFADPQPIEVMAETPDGPPLRFRWRRVLHEVALAEGPERIAPDWWRGGGETATRDYYRIEDTEGRRYWMFRRGLYGEAAGAPCWFLHGLFA